MEGWTRHVAGRGQDADSQWRIEVINLCSESRCREKELQRALKHDCGWDKENFPLELDGLEQGIPTDPPSAVGLIVWHHYQLWDEFASKCKLFGGRAPIKEYLFDKTGHSAVHKENIRVSMKMDYEEIWQPYARGSKKQRKSLES